VVAHICNLALGRLRQEDQEFEVSLDFIVRPCLKKKKRKLLEVARGWEDCKVTANEHKCSAVDGSDGPTTL
jgi:hypothetical protein